MRRYLDGYYFGSTGGGSRAPGHHPTSSIKRKSRKRWKHGAEQRQGRAAAPLKPAGTSVEAAYTPGSSADDDDSADRRYEVFDQSYDAVAIDARGCTLGANLDFFNDRKSVVFGVWAAPGASVAILLGAGGLAPTFLKGLRVLWGLPDPQNNQFPTPKKLRNFIGPQSAAT